jgi:hypothetical protein
VFVWVWVCVCACVCVCVSVCVSVHRAWVLLYPCECMRNVLLGVLYYGGCHVADEAHQCARAKKLRIENL